MNFATLNEAEPGETEAASPEAMETAGDEGGLVAEEKKPVNQSAVMLFILVAVGCGVTYFMHLRTEPASAKAADPASISTEAAITDFMRNGSSNISLLRKLLDDTARVVEQFKDFTHVAQVPLSELKINPFQSNAAKLQPAEDTAEIARKKKEEEHAAVVKAAQGLHLQTIVIRGNRKACMINNTLYHENEVVDRFVVESISPTAVVVNGDGYRFELKMK